MLQLTRRGQLWRTLPKSSQQLGSTQQMINPQVAFEVVPISDFDRPLPYGVEATHVLWVSRWLGLLKEDEVRYGSYTNPAGQVSQFRFVVNGKQDFRIGYPNVAYYVSERQ
jgi:hypothetical protein